MNHSTITRSQRSQTDVHSTPRDRQRCIRKSWSSDEKMRRRELATLQQQLLFEILQDRFERAAC